MKRSQDLQLSIIVPVCNVEDYIRPCIESIFKLPIIGFLLIFRWGEKLHDVIHGEQGAAQDSHDLHDGTSKLEFVLNDSDETVCDNGNMNAYRIVTLSPERLDLEVLHDPFEEIMRSFTSGIERQQAVYRPHSLPVQTERGTCIPLQHVPDSHQCGKGFRTSRQEESLGSQFKTLIHNAMMIHRFSVLSGKLPNKLLNTNDFKELLYYGVANAA